MVIMYLDVFFIFVFIIRIIVSEVVCRNFIVYLNDIGNIELDYFIFFF